MILRKLGDQGVLLLLLISGAVDSWSSLLNKKSRDEPNCCCCIVVGVASGGCRDGRVLPKASTPYPFIDVVVEDSAQPIATESATTDFLRRLLPFLVEATLGFAFFIGFTPIGYSLCFQNV